MVNSPLFAPNGELMAKQYAHSFRFVADYLTKEGLLDANAVRPLEKEFFIDNLLVPIHVII